MFAPKIRSSLAVATVLALALPALTAFAEDMKVPQTAAEHQATAQTYKDQAASYKKSAEEHRQMAAEYAKLHPDFKGGVKNPWNEKMAKHCEKLMKDFEQLAADASEAASFHSMRAKELQGK